MKKKEFETFIIKLIKNKKKRFKLVTKTNVGFYLTFNLTLNNIKHMFSSEVIIETSEYRVIPYSEITEIKEI